MSPEETHDGQQADGKLRSPEASEKRPDLPILLRAIEQSAEYILITDAQGCILYANPALLEQTGFTMWEIAGENPRIFSSGLHPESFYRRMWEALLSRQTFHANWVNRKKTGELYWEEKNISPVTDADGQITHFIATGRNVTERKHFETELQAAKQLAEDADLAKGRFLARMSHEIRTPLHAVLGYADILSTRSPRADQMEFINVMRTRGHDLLALVDDLLEFTTLQQDRTELIDAPFVIRGFAQDMVRAFLPAAQRKNIKLGFVVGDNVPAVAVLDERRFRQIVGNLLSNAIKFTTVGGVTLRILLLSNGPGQPGGTGIRLEVSDTGVGVEPAEHSSIFQAFTQSKGQDYATFGGTGLGLSIANGLVTLMGGSISLDSTPGRGATFMVDLPKTRLLADLPQLLPDSMAARIGREIHAPSGSQAHQRKEGLVLYADDDPDNCSLVRHFLSGTGLDLALAVTGHDAVDQAERLRPDLILLDLHMPEMDGYEAAKRIREQEALRMIPLLILSASALPSDRERLGPVSDGYLTKPISRQRLLDALGAHLVLHQQPGSARTFRPGDVGITPGTAD